MVIGLYWLLSKLDWLIYWVVSMFFRIIMDLADPDKIKFFEDIEVNNIKRKVLVIVGVLMLFKLVFSAIQYLINPDSFDDKEKGMGGVLKRMVITMLLIVLVPVVFEFAFTMQESIVVTIQNIILNTNASEKVDHDRLGQQMSYSVLQSFVRPNNGGTVGGFGDTSAKIHDLDTFRDNAWKGCGLLFDASGCEYDYMIFISTICGGFLCYVLLSLALDVTIRTIKFGIIQILSPIPISSYIFGKEKFNKFMKMAGQVYADLFIRMGIIFAIIAIVQVLIRSGILNPTGMANTGSWIYDMILHVVVIIGLFMFAKNAPKFISELLGIPDIGAGDMADMFKPAWQRAGGAAGALVNPFTTAAANFRQAHRDNGRTVGESLRRAAAGFGRGAVDSLQGVMAGDNWAKMRNRHDTAVKKSGERTLRQIKRERDGTVNERKLTRLRNAMSQLGGAIGLNPQYQQQATQDYNNYVNGLTSRMNTLKSELNSGTLSVDERKAKLQELRDLQAEHSSITSAEGRRDWIENALYYRNAEAEQNTRLTEINNQIGANRTRINAINAQIAGGVTDDERAALELEKDNLMSQSRELAAESSNITSDRNADINTRIEGYKKHNQETEEKRKEYQKQIEIVEAAMREPIHGSLYNSFDTYFGGPGSQGKTYISFAETLGKNRNSIYIGEAMDKLKKNADILVDEHGNPIEYKTQFCTKSNQKFSYEEITRIHSEFKAGQLSAQDLHDNYGLNAATLDSALQEIEKFAARDYLNANIIAADGDRVVDKDAQGNPITLADSIAKETGYRVGLKRGAPNTTVVEWWDRFESDLLASGLPRDEVRREHDEYLRNPGRYISGASDKKERLITRGTRIVDAESPKDGK